METQLLLLNIASLTRITPIIFSPYHIIIDIIIRNTILNVATLNNESHAQHHTHSPKEHQYTNSPNTLIGGVSVKEKEEDKREKGGMEYR